MLELSAAAQAGQEQARAALADTRAALATAVTKARQASHLNAGNAIDCLLSAIAMEPIESAELQALVELVVEMVDSESESLAAVKHLQVAQLAQRGYASDADDAQVSRCKHLCDALGPKPVVTATRAVHNTL